MITFKQKFKNLIFISYVPRMKYPELIPLWRFFSIPQTLSQFGTRVLHGLLQTYVEHVVALNKDMWHP